MASKDPIILQEPINWGDLSVVSVGITEYEDGITVENRPVLLVTVEEADPACYMLCKVLGEKITESLPGEITATHWIEARTEW